MKTNLRQIAVAAGIALCSAALVSPAQAGSAEEAIAAAKEARKQADSVGGDWRDTGKMVKKAEKLLKEGKTKEAEALAREAEAQAMLGYIQATSQPLEELHI
ncbi:MAG: SoxXA-binding protein [Gammaproteobacteria bacterium]|nr:SoxXA-binding protein [Gammaproteobacteria bacterium]